MVERGTAPPDEGATASRRAGQAPPWLIDALLAATVALVLTFVLVTSDRGTRPADAIAYAFAIGFGAILLLRRRMPRTVLVLSVLGVFAYYTLDYPPIGVAVPIIAALYSAAEAGLLAWSVGASVVVLGVSLFFRVLDGEQAIGYVVGYESVSNLALFAAAISLGYGIRAGRLRSLQQAEIVRLTEAQLARDAELQVQAERERISRELHDTVGHTLSVVALQAGVAADALDGGDRAALEAVGRIRAASSRSLHDLRAMVRILRATVGPDETRRVRSLAAVGELVEEARGAGLEVIADIDADSSQLPDPIDVAAFRVIQESITNVIRHAGATRAWVRARVVDDRLLLTVADDGRGPEPGETRAGYGVAGMTERVRLLGGTLVARPDPESGFIVEASIPMRLP